MQGSLFDQLTRPGMKLMLQGRITPADVVKPKTLRYIFLTKYLNMCKSGKLLPIEKLREDDKRHYWKQSEAVGNDRELRVAAAKIYYLCDSIAEEYYDILRLDEVGADHARL